MPRLEEIVRPFQSPFVSPGRAVPVPSSNQNGQTAILRWGDAGKLPTPQSDGYNLKLCQEKLNETSRTTSTKRIENPNDSSQYVILKRTESMSLNKKDDQNVLKSDFTAYLDQQFPQFSAELGGFESEDGSTTQQCKVVLTLKNQ